VTFNALVYALGGLTVAVHPIRQIVLARLSGVTFGLIEPGVRFGSGSPTCVRVGDEAATDDGSGTPEAVGMAARGPGNHNAKANKAITTPRATPIAAQTVRVTA